MVAAAAIGLTLTLSRGRGLGSCLPVLLATGCAAALVAAVFAIGRSAGVVASDRITVMHLGLAAATLVPAALLISGAAVLDRRARGRRRDTHEQRSPNH